MGCISVSELQYCKSTNSASEKGVHRTDLIVQSEFLSEQWQMVNHKNLSIEQVSIHMWIYEHN